MLSLNANTYHPPSQESVGELAERNIKLPQDVHCLQKKQPL